MEIKWEAKRKQNRIWNLRGGDRRYAVVRSQRKWIWEKKSEGNQLDYRDWLFNQEVRRFGIKKNTWCDSLTVLHYYWLWILRNSKPCVFVFQTRAGRTWKPSWSGNHATELNTQEMGLSINLCMNGRWQKDGYSSSLSEPLRDSISDLWHWTLSSATTTFSTRNSQPKHACRIASIMDQKKCEPPRLSTYILHIFVFI